MRYFGRATMFSLLVASLCAAAGAQLETQKTCNAVQQNGPPCVYQVDPPNWWTQLPSPMLLLYGRNLKDAQIAVRGSAVSLDHTQFSANGHYAFVWLKTPAGEAQEVQIRVSTSAGSTTIPFRIAARQTEPHSGFSPTDVMYLIMTDRFADGETANDPNPSQRALPRGWHGGDFRGIEDHLDYLQQLGITTVWTTPVYDNAGSPQAYHGYSATNLYKTDPHFGSLADLRRLSDALHRRGMKLVLDTVPNHVGAANPWAFDPPTPDWFHGTRAHHIPNTDAFGNIVDPHATWEQRKPVLDGWFANVLPDLNQENPIVRQYLIQDVIWWVESADADGLRYDTFPYVGRAFWQSLNGELKVLYPHLTTVGEVYNPNPVITSYFAGGVAHDGIDTGLTTPFDFPTMFAIREALSHHDVIGGGPVRHDDMTGLEDVLREDWLYPHPENLVTFIGNHDTSRFLSLPGVDVSDLKLAFALLATLRGMPQIYSGDEIAMRGGNDPDNRHDFPGGFPGDRQNAFTPTGRTPEQSEVHDWLATLLHFRHDHPVLATGEQQDIFYDPTAFIFVRTPDLHRGCTAGGGSHYVVALNDANQPRTITMNLERTALEGCTTFSAVVGASNVAHSSGSNLTLTLPAKQAILFAAR